MTYHFRTHTEKKLLWAECLELEGCVTQGKSLDELNHNMHEALNLYLEEPDDSNVVFPLPGPRPREKNIATVEVDSGVAFSMLLRQLRVTRGMTQKEAACQLGMRNLYSYQRLERRSNPSLATLTKIKRLFPEISLDAVIGG